MRQVSAYRTKAGDERYKVRFRLGGKETSETFRRKADADTFAAILDGGGALAALAWLDARDKRASEIAFADWHETYVNQLTGVTPRTRDDYRAYRRRYFASIEGLPVSIITRGHVAEIVNRLEREGKAPKTIANAIRHLSSCLALAVEEGHTAANPCRRVRLPSDQLDAHEARFLAPAEFAALLHHLDTHYRPLILFMVGTGLRWSEATAIQSRHVDLANGTVRVAHAWKLDRGKRFLGPPKSKKSRRTVNAATLALAAAAPLLGKPNEYVFQTPTGKIIGYGNFRDRIWLPACKAAGLDPNPGLHSLRHTFASWLISEGISLEAVQDQLGHESILTTRKLYAHLLPAVGVAAGRAASAALDRALVDRPDLRPVLIAPNPGDGADESADPDHVELDVQGGGQG